MLTEIRVEWTELRAVGLGIPELYRVIAEYSSGSWKFSEKSTWEIRWYEAVPTPELVAKAKAEEVKQNCASRRQEQAGSRSLALDCSYRAERGLKQHQRPLPPQMQLVFFPPISAFRTGASVWQPHSRSRLPVKIAALAAEDALSMDDGLRVQVEGGEVVEEAPD